MAENEIKRAIDTCFSDITFTPQHRRVILRKTQKKRLPQRTLRGGFIAVALVASLAIVLFKPPAQDNISTIATSGNGDNGALSTATVVPLTLLTEEEGIALAQTLLVQENKVTQNAVEALVCTAVEQNAEGNNHDGTLWYVRFSQEADSDELYGITVDRLTGEATLVYQKPIEAEEDPEPSAQELAQAELNAYETSMNSLYSDKRFWSLKEKAEWTRLAKNANVQQEEWDVLPDAQAIDKEAAFKVAMQHLEQEAPSLDVSAFTTYVSYIEKKSGAQYWYFMFCETPQAQNGYYVEVNAHTKLIETNSENSTTGNSLSSQNASATLDETESTAGMQQQYYNPSGGKYFHYDANCSSVNWKYLPLAIADNDEIVSQLMPCIACVR